MTCRALAPALLPLLTAAYEHPLAATERSSTALAPKDPDRNRTLCRALRPCNLHEVPRSAPRSSGHAQRSTLTPRIALWVASCAMRGRAFILVATLWALGTPPLEALPSVP